MILIAIKLCVNRMLVFSYQISGLPVYNCIFCCWSPCVSTNEEQDSLTHQSDQKLAPPILRTPVFLARLVHFLQGLLHVKKWVCVAFVLVLLIVILYLSCLMYRFHFTKNYYRTYFIHVFKTLYQLFQRNVS